MSFKVLRRQYYKEIEQGHVSTQSKFNYGRCRSGGARRETSRLTKVGWGLVKSTNPELQTEGVKLLQGTFQSRRTSKL